MMSAATGWTDGIIWSQRASPAPPSHPIGSTPQALRVIFEAPWSPDDPWGAYLSQLADQSLAARVSVFWRAAEAAVGPMTLPAPMAIPSGEGGAHLAWDAEQHHIEVDLFSDGSFDWFYRNRLTDEIDGTREDRASGMPEDLARRIRLVAR